jgi:hypothetical protein
MTDALARDRPTGPSTVSGHTTRQVSRPESLLGPSRAQVWRAARGPLAIGSLLLAVALLGALVVSSGARGSLDPRAADPGGSRALAVLLGQDGVDVRREVRVDGVAAGLGTDDTLLVAFPDRLDRLAARKLAATGADLVLVAASRPEDWVDLVVRRRGGPDDRSGSDAAGNPGSQSGAGASRTQRDGLRAPACSLPAAAAAGSAEVARISYTASRPPGGDAVLCYADDGLAALVVLVDADGRRVTFLGDPRPLTNDRLDEAGNAALALALLGTDGALVWLLPPVTAGSPQAEASIVELIPAEVWWVLGQLAVAVALAAIWRARRLGPVVAEPLPVVVRAAEATEGRARLYRRFRAAERAGEALREATRSRLSRRLGLPRAVPRQVLVEVTARRTGRAPGELDALLHGPPGRVGGAATPERLTDARLVRLADALDTLESEVRRS